MGSLHRDWAHPCHICTGTALTPATSAPGLGSANPAHICTGTWLQRFDELLLHYTSTACTRCKKVPEEPALCLVCGALCCAGSPSLTK
jgi:E3 ubiquitin-protein ligase UBR3